MSDRYRNISGPDWLFHEGFEEELANAGLREVKRSLRAQGKLPKRLTVKEYRAHAAKKKLKNAKRSKLKRKRKLNTSKIRPRGAYSRKHGERQFKDDY